ncbi:MAG: MBL fold metallo-hydrolase [Myxococcaceae bacterium]
MSHSFGKRPSGARLEKLQGSPRYKDGVFHNTAQVGSGLKKGTTLNTMGEFLLGHQRRVPLAPLPAVNPLETWKRPVDTGLRATWLGHSTVLLELGGARLLTDPVWGERASPMTFAGPKRFQPVPVTVAQLPPLDAVLISHDHYDHLDYPTILELLKLDVPFYTSLGVGQHLEYWGVPASRIIELDWWDTVKLPRHEVTITAAPSQHFSGRGVGGRNTTLWSSFAVKSEKHTVFFSGDTGLTPEYGEIRSKLGPFDLVMLEVGAFHPSWGDIHLGPENALEALKLLGGGPFLPVHWGTFNLAIHAWDEPAETLLSKRPSQLLMPMLGAAFEPAKGEIVEPWWREVAALEKKASAKTQRPAELPGENEALVEPID